MKKQLHFTRNHRLLTKTEFESIFDQSKKISQKYVVALFRNNKGAHARLGIIVGKRTAKSAVVRNRIKRIIRESFRCNQNRLKAVDIIIIARKPCEESTKQKLHEGIDALWEKLSI